MDLGQEILKAIQIMVNKKFKNYRADRTYRTVIKEITPKGYVILDETGSERTVPCYVQNVTLRVGQSVYVKEPLGKLNELHICNVVGNTSNSGNLSSRSRIRR